MKHASTIEPPHFGAILARIAARHSRVIVVVSPPRCCSTAFVRVLWEHPAIRYYCHEPFEESFYSGLDLDRVGERLADPIDLCVDYKERCEESGLVVKEMPYQVAERAEDLLLMATAPVIFLIRDPRLAIASRMATKTAAGRNPLFPLVETGWALLVAHISLCAHMDIPYLVVDAEDFRRRPMDVFPRVFRRLGLSFSDAVLRWRPAGHLPLDNLNGLHRHLYTRVLQSTGIEPPSEPVPPLRSFPIESGFRNHVAECLEIYEFLRRSADCPR